MLGGSANADDDHEPTIPKNESGHKNVSSVPRKQKVNVSLKKKGDIATPMGSDIDN